LTEDGLRIVSFLLAVALLLGASKASFAEEAGASAPGDSKAAISPAEPSGAPSSGENAAAGAAKIDSVQHGQGKGDDAKTPNGDGKATSAVTNDADGFGRGHENDNAIDTRIGMPSHRLDGGRRKVGNVQARVRLLQPRRLSAPGPFDQSVRNAIGVPLARREGLERREGEHRGAPSIRPGQPGAGTTVEGHVDRPSVLRTETSRSVSPSILNRGAINGTSALRPGAGSHGIGGPTKAAAGISGTAIRSKH